MAKSQNSSTALGVAGAEKLSGEGAILFKSQAGSIKHLQGSYVTTDEIKNILSLAPVGCDDLEMLELIEPETEYLPAMDDRISLGKEKNEKANQELAYIAMWALGRDSVSNSEIMKLFHMSKRAKSVIDKLFKMGIIGEYITNQSRKVLPLTIDDLSPETVAFLEQYGYDEAKIRGVLNAKSAICICN